jgi:ketosteroid isomerase-like protein
MDITTRFAIEMGDLALMSNEWHFTSDDVELSGITAEVARRQPNGTWLYVIDNPYALAFPVS